MMLSAQLEIFFHVLVYSCQPIVASVRFRVPQEVVRQLSCPKSGPSDLTVLTIGSALSKGWRSGPEAFRAGHYKDLTETGNRARKVSGTQGSSQSVVKNIGLKNWKTASNACLRHEFLALELKEAFKNELGQECKNFTKGDSCLKESSRDQLAVFSNKTLCKELEMYCPLLYTVLCQASNLLGSNSEEATERAVNAVALAFSSLIRCRNPKM